MFLSVQEPRLRKLLGKELSAEKSKEYLKSLGEVDVNDEVLTSNQYREDLPEVEGVQAGRRQGGLCEERDGGLGAGDRGDQEWAF